MNAAHTPGPWLAEERFDDECSLGLAVYAAGAEVARLPGIGRQNVRDAALIAAAPDLLEALQMCFRANQELRAALDEAKDALVDKHSKVREWGKVYRESLPSGMQARAAIAKATGSAE
jgi:hypothetical protein